MKKYGLIGFPLGHSFSKRFFDSKFASEGLSDCCYQPYELLGLEGFREWVRREDLRGLNVTIPYKEAVIPLLDSISDEARLIGAVNVVKVMPDGSMRGFNTDAPAFAETLRPLLKPWHTKALVFGTGGAAKAVAYALKQSGIEYCMVSRKGNPYLSYPEAAAMAKEVFLLINATPVGMYPHTEEMAVPQLPALSERHLCYDLIYNPEETLFLAEAKRQGAAIRNGQPMLELQAEMAWNIWTDR